MPGERYFAHGKVLISGEYAVLKGAKGLALPTIVGQELSVSEGTNDIHWESIDHLGKKWFEARFDLKLNVIKAWDTERAEFIKKLLQASYSLSKSQVKPTQFCSFLEFPSNWGLGSSSTLTHLLAQYFRLDPFDLFFKTQNGSGYDIACAGSTLPIEYQLINNQPKWKVTNLSSVYEDSRFVYLGMKQDSRKEVVKFNQLDISSKNIQEISEITDAFIAVNNKEELQDLMRIHERVLSRILQRPSVSGALFPDYKGAVKSLGAWGGDYVMALGEGTDDYFNSKGYTQILSYHDLFAPQQR